MFHLLHGRYDIVPRAERVSGYQWRKTKKIGPEGVHISMSKVSRLGLYREVVLTLKTTTSRFGKSN